MKKFLLIFSLFFSLYANAQISGATQLSDLPVIGISKNASLHFISPEPILYADFSSAAVKGDLPLKNVLHVKLLKDSLHLAYMDIDLGVITIITERFIVKYRMAYLSPEKTNFISSEIEIQPELMKPLDISGVSLSNNERRKNALDLLSKRALSPVRKVSNYGIGIALNQIYTVGDEVFLDLAFSNETNLAYDVDELRFKIEDQKINKATNVQSVELKPLFQLYGFERFKKHYRNIYVLKKATFPENKVLNISLTEKQVSGRNLCLTVKYKDVLAADTI